MKKIIVLIILSVVMTALGFYYLNKFNNYPMQKVVHCYLIDKGQDEPFSEHFYTIENGKIVNRLDISRIGYAIAEDKYQALRERWESYNEYKGYLSSSIQGENSSFEIRYYDYRYLTDEEYTEIWYQEPDSDNYHVTIYIEDAQKVSEDFIKDTRKYGYICY